MKLSRIDQIALNGATGEHYKYEKIAEDIMETFTEINYGVVSVDQAKGYITRLLIRSFPNDET